MTLYTRHEIACIIADLLGDTCACKARPRRSGCKTSRRQKQTEKQQLQNETDFGKILSGKQTPNIFQQFELTK